MAELEEILKERGANYGAFSGHAAVTQDIKTTMYQGLSKNEKYLNLPDAKRVVVAEALDMIAHKIGRIVNGDPLFQDSWDDIAGYAKLVSQHTKGE